MYFFVAERSFCRLCTENERYPVLHVFNKRHFIRRDSVFGRRFILQARRWHWGDSGLLRFPQWTLEPYPHQQCHWEAEPGDSPPHPCGGQFPGRQLCPDAGLCQAAPCSRHPVGQQKVYEYEAPGGCPWGRLHCRLTSFIPGSANQFAQNSWHYQIFYP